MYYVVVRYKALQRACPALMFVHYFESSVLFLTLDFYSVQHLRCNENHNGCIIPFRLHYFNGLNLPKD